MKAAARREFDGEVFTDLVEQEREHVNQAQAEFKQRGVAGLLEQGTEEYGQDKSQLGQSMASPGSCPLRGGPLELGLMSVAKLQVSLIRLGQIGSRCLNRCPYAYMLIFMDL